MKLAVTAQGMGLDSGLDPRFGRAKYFIVVDTETGAFSVSDNSVNLSAVQGAGIQAGKRVIELGAEGVITGHVGPKAFAALQSGGLNVYTGASGTVADAIRQFKAGELIPLESADVGDPGGIRTVEPGDCWVFSASTVVDATGHEAVAVHQLCKRGLLDASFGRGEGPMDAGAGESFVVERVAEVYPGLWVAGMSVCATFGGPRMGPIFGGMLLSGKRAAEGILGRTG